jgi:hypothetical protein
MRIVTISCLATLLAGMACPAEPLSEGFLNPPDSARPRVWWHWVNGNISESGIDADLAWLKSVGIGGVQNFDVNLSMPTIVPKRIAYMTPEWKHAFAHAVDVATASGLEFAIASSPGWSETGAPWVTPADAMKKLVWSETTVTGGRRFKGRLTAPPAATGLFQDLPYNDPLAGPGDAQHGAAPYYQEIGVLAIPAMARTSDEVPAARGGNGEVLDAKALSDELLSTEAALPQHAGEMPTVALTYSKPVALRTARLFVAGATSPFGPPAWRAVFEVRGEGGWSRVADLPVDSVPSTVSFAPVQAREFRVRFESPRAARSRIGAGAPGAIAVDIFPKPAADAPLRLAMLQLSTEPRVSHFEQKAGFAVALDYDALASQGVADEMAIAPSQVIDLTSRMNSDGALHWTPPPGRWRIIRMGWSLTGTTNHPANPEATGLEVDKYDGAAVRRYLETYLRGYQDAVGEERIGARGISALLTDSTEVGASNWTACMPEQFRALRGYDLKPWLPALAGFIVESRARTDAFLFDYRRTLAELHAREHYGTLATVAHEHGLTVYGEALEDRRPTLGDDLAMRAFADIPMAALWTYPRGQSPRSSLLGDMKGASSVAHVRGRSAVAAESMTSAFAPWAFAPHDLRRIVDLEFAQGINRPVIHTSVHQPLDDKVPGLTLAIFGQYFNRHESWAGMARPWIDYIARSSYLLQQGHDVADIAWFIGEERPLTALFAEGPPAGLPKHHAWDAIDADMLKHEVRVEQGALVTSGGARYAALYLGGASQAMTLPTLRRLRELVDAGATIIGEAPVAGRGINDDVPAFASLVVSLWKSPVMGGNGGRVVASRDVDAALDSIGVKPDVELHAEGAPAEVLSVHRRLPDADVYFIDNRDAKPAKLEAVFRTAGREPQRWRAESGAAEPLSWRSEAGRTHVQLELGPEESTFVVFSKPTKESAGAAPAVQLGTLARIEGPWDVSFQPGRGAPATARFTQLASLSGHSDPGIRYFSGVATYRTSFDLKRGVARGAPLLLDLGGIGDVAEVSVNGKPVGTTWWPPYRLDIGAAVRRGRNTLEVRVANLWVNRLIGDAQPGATPVAFATGPTYFPNAPLRPSGLIGPVKLLAQ